MKNESRKNGTIRIALKKRKTKNNKNICKRNLHFIFLRRTNIYTLSFFFNSKT